MGLEFMNTTLHIWYLYSTEFTDPAKALYCALYLSCTDVYHPRYLFGSHFIQTNESWSETVFVLSTVNKPR